MKRQRNTLGRNDCDASETPSTKKIKQMDDESSVKTKERDTPGRDDSDESKTASTKKMKQEDDESSEKVFNDPIHGHIELHPLLVSIIDTRQFQRLRHIKQLGGGYYVFPGASHNRFEHSLGVSYLAGEFVESLQRRQEELRITDKDVLCIKIAGLCHDLGHGPFSHLFDGQFIPLINKCSTWKHEQASVDMLQYLIDDNDLWPQFEIYSLTINDLIFIKELIAGPIQPFTPLKQDSSSHNWPYQGRPRNKSFLYEIVANKRNGVDVDKWDYFARDCQCLGIPNNFDWRRYMKFARVLEVDNIYQICCRDKGVVDLYEMFHTRVTLHRKAYKHKTVKIVEKMITEALVEANEHLYLRGKDGKKIKMSDAIYDMVAFTQLNDTVLQQIMMSENKKLTKAKDLLRKVEQRKLYKLIGQTQLSLESNVDTIKTKMLSSKNCGLTEDDLCIDDVSFDYGMKVANPIDNMYFYAKREPDKPLKIRKEQVSQMLPQTFHEKIVRVYCKRLDKHSIQVAENCFKIWCKNHDHTINPKTLEELSVDDFTPYSTYTPSKKKDTCKDKTGNDARINLSEKFSSTAENPS